VLNATGSLTHLEQHSPLLDIRSDQHARNVQALCGGQSKLTISVYRIFIAMQSNRQVAAASSAVSFGGSEQAAIFSLLPDQELRSYLQCQLRMQLLCFPHKFFRTTR